MSVALGILVSSTAIIGPASVAGAATAMTPVGLLLATPIADLTGVRTWYVAAGMACTILGAATFLVRPIREMEGLPAIEAGRD